MTAPEGAAAPTIERIRRVLEDAAAVLPAAGSLYQDLHRHPELSGAEQRTAGVVAERFRAAGLDVAEGIGGCGVVGMLRNGDGPTVALRADMDALPIREATGLPYASEATAVRSDGATVGVMHACGHDLHTACLVATAELLAGARDAWGGTLLLLAQPAEETISGAAAMLADGLFERFPRPDAVLGQHALHARAGTLLHRAGPLMAASRNLAVTIHGKGGHGSTPHVTVDPVVIAAQAVVQLQTIVSREVNPNDAAVVTVGSISGGTRYNIVPSQVTLQLTTRGFSEAIMDRLQASIERIVEAVCAAGRSPRPPDIEVVERTFATVNDPATSAAVRAVHEALYGEEVVEQPEPIMGSEDFALYGMPGPDRYPEPPIPTDFWFLGTVANDVWEQANGADLLTTMAALPGPHTPHFAPDPEPSLRRGVEALTAAALAHLELR